MLRRVLHIFNRIVREWPGLVRAVFLAWRNPPVYPHTLQIEHTSRCNLKCVMCAHGIGKPPGLPDFDFDEFVALAEWFKGAGARPGFSGLAQLHLQGVGEPFLHKQLLPMLRAAKALGLKTSFVSNMTILTEAMARELVEIGHDLVMASVDAIDPAKMADIRRGAKYDVLGRVLDNLALLQRVKQETGSQRPAVMVNSLLMRHTVDDVPELVRRLRALGVAHIYFNDVQNSDMDPAARFHDGSPCKEQSLIGMDADEKRALLARIKALGDPQCTVSVPGEDGAALPGREGVILTCADLWEKPYLTAEGYVTPCCHAFDKSTLPMGNLREQRFEDIWFGPAYQRLRWQHLTGRAPGYCLQCTELNRVVAHTRLRPPEAGLRPYTNVFMGRRPRTLGLLTALRRKRFL